MKTLSLPPVPTKYQSSVESILFSSLKVKPMTNTGEEDSTVLSMETSNMKSHPKNTRQCRINTHLLENTAPNLILQKIFQPYLLLVKILGCQPIKMHPNGCATFSFVSWSFLYCVVVFGFFLFDTFFYLPIMRKMNSDAEKNPLVYVTEVIMVSSQIFAALVSYVFMTVRANELAHFWNRLQSILVKLVARCPNHLDLVGSYRSARMKIITWLMFTIVFGSCYIASFHDEIREYLNEQHYQTVTYWTMFLSFAGYSILLSVHILHSTCFTTFICVLSSCFHTLGNIAVNQDGQGSMRNSISNLLFHDVTEIYEELVELKTMVGNIYGWHIGLEILAMIICVTINIFFIIFRPGFSSLLLLNVAIVMPYVIWFLKVCEACGELNQMMKSCYKRFRRSMLIIAKTVPVEELSPLQVEHPEPLSAAGYFLIEKRLFTSVMGTIATYLVVMLQFAFSSGNLFDQAPTEASGEFKRAVINSTTN